ncbi:MAG: hypothetical protein IJ072_08730, partial [Oscillospiraceae bacterium]|nr:hypothetical protein [Oscillospiraceae bacterium]
MWELRPLAGAGLLFCLPPLRGEAVRRRDCPSLPGRGFLVFVVTLKRDGASGADRGVEVSPSGATYFRCAAKVGKDAPK